MISIMENSNLHVGGDKTCSDSTMKRPHWTEDYPIANLLIKREAHKPGEKNKVNVQKV